MAGGLVACSWASGLQEGRQRLAPISGSSGRRLFLGRKARTFGNRAFRVPSGGLKNLFQLAYTLMAHADRPIRAASLIRGCRRRSAGGVVRTAPKDRISLLIRDLSCRDV